MRNDKIIVRGAREHNLKNVSLELPRDSLIVMTGLSGSGKSSLAFDTIAQESSRQWQETLPLYLRSRMPHHCQQWPLCAGVPPALS